MPDLSGKHGLIVGVANKRSISWAIARAASAAGARIALTYASERLEENVRELAAGLPNPVVQTSREGFRIALDVSAYSLVGLTRACAPLMNKRGGGSIVTLTFVGSE